MKYRFYMRLNTSDGNWVKVGNIHEIQWDTRDLIKASSGWIIVNKEKAANASDLIPKLHKGILELKNSPDTYFKYELDHGLGTIKNTLAFYEDLLQDCKQYPFAELCGTVEN